MGGAELLLLELFRRIAERHEVLLLAPEPDRRVASFQSSSEYDGRVNFDVERYRDRLNLLALRGQRITQGRIPPFSLSCAAATLYAVRRFQPDVVNVNYIVPCGLAALASRAAGRVPVVLSYIGRDIPGPGTPAWWPHWHRMVLRWVSGVAYGTDYSRKQMPPPAGVAWALMYGGCEADDRAERPGREDVPDALAEHVRPGQRVIFALGRWSPEKQMAVAVRAAVRVTREREDVVAVLGGKGPDLAPLRRWVKEQDASERVRLPGFLTDEAVAWLYEHCELFFFHSTYETFGLVLADAMARGKAVVSVHNSAIPDTVPPDECGLLVPTGDDEAMAEAILRLLDDDAARRRMGEAGLRRARELYSWDRAARILEDLLTQAAAGKSR